MSLGSCPVHFPVLGAAVIPMTLPASKILVDDIETSAEGLKRLLTVQGYDVRVEYDGTSALAAWCCDPA